MESQNSGPALAGASTQARPTADVRAQLAYDAGKKSMLLAYVLWFFVGGLGVHRFYLGRIGSGVALLALFLICWLLGFITLGIGFVALLIPAAWLLIDAFLIPGMVNGHNQALVSRLTN
jgi:TM2 domain-containing membrane protein YozV